MKTVKHLALALLSVPLLLACTANQNDEALDNRENNNFQDVRYDRNNNDNEIFDNRDVDTNNQPRIEVADEAVDRITELEEVKTANILVTDQNAYVAVVLNNGTKGNMTNQLEEKIADEVRTTDPDIENVFVSSNPDFIERMNDYAGRVNDGDPIEGFFEEFNETVLRIFPNAQ